MKRSLVGGPRAGSRGKPPQPSNGLPDRLARDAETLGDHSVAEAELAEVEGVRRDLLIARRLLLGV